MRTCLRSGDSVLICSGGAKTDISSLMFSPWPAEAVLRGWRRAAARARRRGSARIEDRLPIERQSGVLVGIDLTRRGRTGRLRLGAFLGFLLGGGLFGVLDRLEALALATFEFVVRLACHRLGLLVVRGVYATTVR